MIAGLGAVFMPNKLAANIDKAQTIAAQHALRELGVHVDGMISYLSQSLTELSHHLSARLIRSYLLPRTL